MSITDAITRDDFAALAEEYGQIIDNHEILDGMPPDDVVPSTPASLQQGAVIESTTFPGIYSAGAGIEAFQNSVTPTSRIAFDNAVNPDILPTAGPETQNDPTPDQQPSVVLDIKSPLLTPNSPFGGGE